MKTLFNFFAKRNFSFSVSILAILFIFSIANSSNAQLVTIGTGTVASWGIDGAYCEQYRSHKVQYLYLGSELVANGAPITGNSINSIAFYCNTTTTYPLVNWTIKISQSNIIADLASPYTGTFTTVYTLPSNTPVANGWNTYSLTTPYYWQGAAYNIVVEVCNDLTVPASSATGTNSFTWTSFTSTRHVASDVIAQCGSNTIATSTFRANIQLNFSAPVSCTGIPAATAISANQTSVCLGNSFTLSATGINSIYGLTYQWQSSSNCAGTWGNISGATGIYFVNSQTNSTCYRLLTTCTPSALSLVSNTVTINTNTPSNCYCSGFPTSASDEDIGNVTVLNSSTLNNTSTCSSIGPGPNSVQNIYSNYSTLPSLQLAQTTTAVFSLKSITCGGNFGNFMQIYIDYNVDGDFNDAGELVYQPTTIFTGPHTETGSFIIPMNATIGSSRLRVRVLEEFPSSGVYPYTGNANACYQYQYGETEDYNVNISSPSNCTGLPSAGTTATTSLTPVCSNQTFILSTTTAPSNGTSITYQWEENCNSMGWTNIGVNSGVIAATPNNLFTSVTNLPSAPSCCQFRLRVVCGFSGQTAISAPVTVCGDLPTNCYCIPSYTNGNNIGNGDYLNQIVDFGGYTGPVTGPNATAPNYYIYTPATIASIAKGSQYNITLNNCPLNSEYFRV
ncbi:hypothetical protein LBMAG27_15560 [Bacteroidota bacterium]|nr:hypothetical protein LBMAG27_15560 [Bacteroidota bacterium]